MNIQQSLHDNAQLKTVLVLLLMGPCWALPALANSRSMVVTVTAYNSVPGQTQGDPKKAAWNDKLRPGMHVIAVSRDLIPLGLTKGTRVHIQRFKNEFVVWDKAGPRIKRTVDIYMGKHVKKARDFGRKRLRIWWDDKKGSSGKHRKEQ